MITTISANLRIENLSPGVLTAFEVKPDNDRVGTNNSTLSISLTLSSDLPCSNGFPNCLVTLVVPKLGDVANPNDLVLDEDNYYCDYINVSV